MHYHEACGTYFCWLSTYIFAFTNVTIQECISVRLSTCALKAKSRQDADYVLIGGTLGCRNDTTGDDNFGIMTTSSFQCDRMFWYPIPGDTSTVPISAMTRITYMDFILDHIFFTTILKHPRPLSAVWYEGIKSIWLYDAYIEIFSLQ